jgi:hypothetical protein
MSTGNDPSLPRSRDMTESPLHLWIAIWQRQIVNSRP